MLETPLLFDLNGQDISLSRVVAEALILIWL
jgi:hypothetical protein